MALSQKKRILTTGGVPTDFCLWGQEGEQLDPARGGAINFAHLVHPLDYGSAKFILPPNSPQRQNPRNLEKLDRLIREGKKNWLHKLLEDGLKAIALEAIGSITLRVGRRRCQGVFLVVPHFMYELASDDSDIKKMCREVIYRAPAVAERLGAKFLGYGAGTSIVTDNCDLALKQPDASLPVCSGSSGTALGIRGGVLKAAHAIQLKTKRSHLVVIGPGSVGGPAAWLLSHRKIMHNNVSRFAKITLVARNYGGLRRRKAELEALGVSADRIDLVILDPKLNPETRAKQLNEVIANGDVIVLATNVAYAEELGILSKSFLPGAVVADVGRPRNISAEVVVARPDVLFIEGATFFMPGETDADEILQMGGPKCVFGCLAEVAAWALAGHRTSESVGLHLSIEKIYELDRLFKKFHFRVAGLRMFDRPLAPENINIVREALRSRLAARRRRLRARLPASLAFRPHSI